MPSLDVIDHIHVYVADRAAAETWYRQVLGLIRVASLEFWAADGGPLTLQNDDSSVHLALFQKANVQYRCTVAFRVSAPAFCAWRDHLSQCETAWTVADHQVSMSLYFADPDGNPYEITTYDYAEVRDLLAHN
ncbi:VOC family protein [Chitinibacter bivalviorum]|uniref:VOC family protein n=1 Tax=Chitinibacter bivalviorum TaxID=2739434 RepID=A0A7H9BM48_9NEIS|nr:VOC family protein [Chitinibacter bivalviorum]